MSWVASPLRRQRRPATPDSALLTPTSGGGVLADLSPNVERSAKAGRRRGQSESSILRVEDATGPAESVAAVLQADSTLLSIQQADSTGADESAQLSVVPLGVQLGTSFLDRPWLPPEDSTMTDEPEPPPNGPQEPAHAPPLPSPRRSLSPAPLVCAHCGCAVRGQYYEKAGTAVHRDCFALFRAGQRRSRGGAAGRNRSPRPRAGPPPCPVTQPGQAFATPVCPDAAHLPVRVCPDEAHPPPPHEEVAPVEDTSLWAAPPDRGWAEEPVSALPAPHCSNSPFQSPLLDDEVGGPRRCSSSPCRHPSPRLRRQSSSPRVRQSPGQQRRQSLEQQQLRQSPPWLQQSPRTQQSPGLQQSPVVGGGLGWTDESARRSLTDEAALIGGVARDCGDVDTTQSSHGAEDSDASGAAALTAVGFVDPSMMPRLSAGADEWLVPPSDPTPSRFTLPTPDDLPESFPLSSRRSPGPGERRRPERRERRRRRREAAPVCAATPSLLLSADKYSSKPLDFQVQWSTAQDVKSMTLPHAGTPAAHLTARPSTPPSKTLSSRPPSPLTPATSVPADSVRPAPVPAPLTHISFVSQGVVDESVCPSPPAPARRAVDAACQTAASQHLNAPFGREGSQPRSVSRSPCRVSPPQPQLPPPPSGDDVAALRAELDAQRHRAEELEAALRQASVAGAAARVAAEEAADRAAVAAEAAAAPPEWAQRGSELLRELAAAKVAAAAAMASACGPLTCTALPPADPPRARSESAVSIAALLTPVGRGRGRPARAGSLASRASSPAHWPA